MYTYKVKEIVRVVDGDTVDILVDLGFGDMKISLKGNKKKIKDFKPGKRLDNITLEKTHNTLLKKNLIRYDGNSYNVTVNGQKNFKSLLNPGKLPTYFMILCH